MIPQTAVCQTGQISMTNGEPSVDTACAFGQMGPPQFEAASAAADFVKLGREGDHRTIDTVISDRAILFVVKGDMTVAKTGAQLRFRESLTFLSKYFSNITLYSFFEDAERPWDDMAQTRFSKYFPGVRLVLDHRPLYHRLIIRSKKFLTALFPDLVKPLMKLTFPWLSPGFKDLKSGIIDPCLFVCGVDNLLELNGVPDAIRIADTLDVDFVHRSKINKLPIYNWSIIARLRLEMSLIDCCDALIAISRAEAEMFSLLDAERGCYFLPTFEDLSPVTRQKKAEYDIDLLFVGTDYSLNVFGLLSFLKENRDWLMTFRIAVAGKASLHPLVVELASDWPGVKLLGFVDDLGQTYARTKLAISPVEGTGLKIKIVEALRNGTPVAASKSSLTGLPSGYHDCVVPLNQVSVERILNQSEALTAAEQATLDYLPRFSSSDEKMSLVTFMSAGTHGPRLTITP
jgi:glycosyltransferase involved in cell wall biosynthesis